MKIKLTVLIIFCASIVDPKPSWARDIIKNYKHLNLENLGTLRHKDAHYESKYFSSFMYEKSPSSTGGTDTKYLFYPYLPVNYCKKTKGGAKEVEISYNVNLPKLDKEVAIKAINYELIESRAKKLRYFYSLPYVISYDRINEKDMKEGYAVLAYDHIFDYLSIYTGTNSVLHNEDAIKGALGVKDLNVWKFFLINQLIVGLKMIHRTRHMHVNIGVNSVMLRSKTEAGWFDTDQLYEIDKDNQVEKIDGMVKRYDKKNRISTGPKDVSFKRYKDYKFYYKETPYSHISLKNYKIYSYTTASSVAAFAILIIDMFARGFGKEFRKTKFTTLEDFFESYCGIKKLRGDLICTYMKSLIIKMLGIDLGNTVSIDAFHAEFVSVMLEILKADKSAIPQEEGESPISIDEASRIQKSVESFQDNFGTMVNLRIQDKYDNCRMMPLKKTFISHIVSFLLDNHSLQKEITGCKPKYGKNLRPLLKESTIREGNDLIFTNSCFYTNSNYSCYVEIAERFRTEICMKAFFEDEAHIFAPYYKANKNLKEMITTALPYNEFEDHILDIWVKAIETGLDQVLQRDII